MGLIKGFVFGLFVGFAAGTAIRERQRREVAERIAAMARRRTQPLVDSPADNASQAADTATDAMTERIDDAADAVDERIESVGPATPS